ncbi:Putative serine aminopeptidase, S33, alpha/Beta hydrolase [Septoria linicola]|uniref:Serine aminopeptidase, S33, alpha/Beta hydrolase n=1 Tax=Septoria linicola TaxID=215465 RepID=A0A9Q9B5N5_9PEZI|nr:putative serine aminopeptidase, S33, alpha/Beta hydrolase [Septoria linicola]USW57606.1 Putative serine aminopeptidase, S33, alpha/Beta hydrolase [Septoria linicola]
MAGLLPWLRLPFYLSAAAVSLGGGALYYFQNEIIYPRNLPPGTRTEVPRPSQFGIEDYEELSIPTPDGETLSAFLIRPSNRTQTRPITILSFHGNAGNIGHRLPIAKVLSQDLGCTTVMLEYRGYGLSTGNPNEKGLAIDAQTGLDYIRNREDLKGNKIIVYGQSLGGAVSIDLVTKNKGTGDIKGLMLENTFLSIAKMIPKAVPVAKYLTPLCHEYWRSEEMIPQITDVPILFLSGLRDEIVPPSHMKELFKLARTPRVMWKELPYGDHNATVAEPGYFQFVEEFIQRYVVDA